MGITVKAGAFAGVLLTGRYRPSAPTAAASGHSRALGVVTLITWLLAAGIGAYMLRTSIARGALRRQRAIKGALPPAVLFGHFGLALTGLVVWVGYLATGYAALAWTAVGLLMPAIGLGISTVTLWTPYPGPGAGVPSGMLAAPTDNVLAGRLTDDLFASALTDDVLAGQLVEDVVARVRTAPPQAAKKPRGHLSPLIPAGHGVAAFATFLLAVLSAVGTT
ncbi:MAG: hypothetical protein ACM3ML_39180 [Micromonosporaceae bacterium]